MLVAARQRQRHSVDVRAKSTDTLLTGVTIVRFASDGRQSDDVRCVLPKGDSTAKFVANYFRTPNQATTSTNTGFVVPSSFGTGTMCHTYDWMTWLCDGGVECTYGIMLRAPTRASALAAPTSAPVTGGTASTGNWGYPCSGGGSDGCTLLAMGNPPDDYELFYEGECEAELGGGDPGGGGTACMRAGIASVSPVNEFRGAALCPTPFDTAAAVCAALALPEISASDLDVTFTATGGNSSSVSLAGLPDVADYLGDCTVPPTIAQQALGAILQAIFDAQKCQGNTLCNTLFARYLYGNGAPYFLSSAQFVDMLNTFQFYQLPPGIPFSSGGQPFTYYDVSFYNTPFAFIFGTGRFAYNAAYSPAGFIDRWDLDWHDTPRAEEKDTEWKVRVASVLSAPLFPTPFNGVYGTTPPSPN